jgi:hypothetical protein
MFLLLEKLSSYLLVIIVPIDMIGTSTPFVE